MPCRVTKLGIQNGRIIATYGKIMATSSAVGPSSQLHMEANGMCYTAVRSYLVSEARTDLEQK